MTDTSDLSHDQKRQFENWAHWRAFGRAIEFGARVGSQCLPRRRFDLRGYRLKLDDARLDLDEPRHCMVIRDGVLRAAAPFLPPPTGADALVYTQSPAAVVAMNLKNSHAALEAETLRKERDALAFEYAECQQELLEERESHCGTWQCAQDLLAKEDAAHAQTRGALARVLKERGSLERQLSEADWRMHLYRCACISLALIVLVEVIKHLVKAWQ